MEAKDVEERGGRDDGDEMKPSPSLNRVMEEWNA